MLARYWIVGESWPSPVSSSLRKICALEILRRHRSPQLESAYARRRQAFFGKC